MRLLIAEDDLRMLQSLQQLFQKNRYAVDVVSNGADALAYAETGVYDGLILDILMSGLDGLEVLRQVRRQGIATPALFLTAQAEIPQRVEGLDAGADDYLAKPFSPTELLARVRAMLRRREAYIPETLRLGELSLNCASCQLQYASQFQPLRGKELQIMELLMQRSGGTLSLEELFDRVWGWNSNVETSVVWVHISQIRKKLALLDAPYEIRFIRGAGYTLAAR